MTKIVFEKKHHFFKSITAIGHAGYAQEGEDIVCAAITSGMQWLHILLTDVLKLSVDTQVEQAQTRISFVLPDDMCLEKQTEVQHAMQAMYFYYTELAKEYDSFIKVTEVQFDAKN